MEIMMEKRVLINEKFIIKKLYIEIRIIYNINKI